MKAPLTLLLLVAIHALAQGFFSGTATFTISGTAVTVGGTNSGIFAVATTTAASSDDDGDAAEDISASSSYSYNGNLDSLTSAYSGSPITIEYGSTTIVLGGTAASGGFSNSANATATSSSTSGSDSGGSATAVPSGPTTSLSLPTQSASSASSTAQAVSGVLALVGLALAFVL